MDFTNFTHYLLSLRTEAIEQLHYSHTYWTFLLPLALIAADIVSGWIQATINSTWDSTKMRKGLFRKTLEILAIVVLFVVGLAFSLPALPWFASIYVVFMEGVSILENLDLAGIPVPIWLVKKLKKTMETMTEGEAESK